MSNNLSQSPLAAIETQLAQVAAGGVDWVREDFTWSIIEPQRGVYNWTSFDRLMQAASVERVNVLAILDYSAPWASSDPSGAGNPFFPPSNNADYAAYAAAVAARYGAGGSFWALNPGLTPMPLGAVEIWNEPYGDWYWKPGPSPSGYAAMVAATAPAVHAVDPKMTVLMSGDLQSWDSRNAATGSQVQPWLARVLAANPNLGNLVDGLDVHPYPSPRSAGPYDTTIATANSFARVPLIRQTELAAHVTVPIWITEVGWSLDPGGPNAISVSAQAADDVGAVHRSIDEWGAYVSKIFLFGWYRANGVANDSSDNFGLVETDGSLSPAWDQLSSLLGGVPGASDPSASTVN